MVADYTGYSAEDVQKKLDTGQPATLTEAGKAFDTAYKAVDKLTWDWAGAIKKVAGVKDSWTGPAAAGFKSYSNLVANDIWYANKAIDKYKKELDNAESALTKAKKAFGDWIASDEIKKYVKDYGEAGQKQVDASAQKYLADLGKEYIRVAGALKPLTFPAGLQGLGDGSGSNDDDNDEKKDQSTQNDKDTDDDKPGGSSGHGGKSDDDKKGKNSGGKNSGGSGSGKHDKDNKNKNKDKDKNEDKEDKHKNGDKDDDDDKGHKNHKGGSGSGNGPSGSGSGSGPSGSGDSAGDGSSGGDKHGEDGSDGGDGDGGDGKHPDKRPANGELTDSYRLLPGAEIITKDGLEGIDVDGDSKPDIGLDGKPLPGAEMVEYKGLTGVDVDGDCKPDIGPDGEILKYAPIVQGPDGTIGIDINRDGIPEIGISGQVLPDAPIEEKDGLRGIDVNNDGRPDIGMDRKPLPHAPIEHWHGFKGVDARRDRGRGRQRGRQARHRADRRAERHAAARCRRDQRCPAAPPPPGDFRSTEGVVDVQHRLGRAAAAGERRRGQPADGAHRRRHAVRRDAEPGRAGDGVDGRRRGSRAVRRVAGGRHGGSGRRRPRADPPDDGARGGRGRVGRRPVRGGRAARTATGIGKGTSMTSAFESAMSEAMAELEKQRNELVRLQQHFNEHKTSARSKRRQISVTVDARGHLTDLKFHGQGYKTMAASDLAKLIVDTVSEARQAAEAQMWEAAGESLPEGVDLARAAAGKQDWSGLLDEAMTLPKPIMDLLSSPPRSPADDGGLDSLLGALGRAAKLAEEIGDAAEHKPRTDQ
jgi:DNA-binding protein YbaB